MINNIINKDWIEGLKELPEKSIDMCITSPPYWGLRDYGVDGQLGLESDFNEYIDKLCNGFDEVKRVLKNSGTCWVNLGDGYASGSASTNTSKNSTFHGGNKQHRTQTGIKAKSLPQKSLVGIPFRFAIEMINRGWILRNTIIWHKPNCMPSSVKDRFTVDFEYLFFFSKNKKYYFEQQFEPVKEESIKRLGRAVSNKHKNSNGAPGQTPHTLHKPRPNIKTCKEAAIQNTSGFDDKDHLVAPFNPEKGRNKRTVWEITTKPYKGAHFAVFPPELIETPIKAGCPENGLVLDPFMGSGTTAMVAKSLGRNYIGFELNPEYISLIDKRVEETQKPLTVY